MQMTELNVEILDRDDFFMKLSQNNDGEANFGRWFARDSGALSLILMIINSPIPFPFQSCAVAVRVSVHCASAAASLCPLPGGHRHAPSGPLPPNRHFFPSLLYDCVLHLLHSALLPCQGLSFVWNQQKIYWWKWLYTANRRNAIFRPFWCQIYEIFRYELNVLEKLC